MSFIPNDINVSRSFFGNKIFPFLVEQKTCMPMFGIDTMELA